MTKYSFTFETKDGIKKTCVIVGSDLRRAQAILASTYLGSVLTGGQILLDPCPDDESITEIPNVP